MDLRVVNAYQNAEMCHVVVSDRFAANSRRPNLRDLLGENGTTIGVDDDFTPDENQAFVVCGSLLSPRPLCFGAPVDKGTLKSLYDPGRHIFDGFLTRRGDNLFIFIAED